MVGLVIFSALSFLALAYGFLSLTKATMGVGLIAIGCALLIMGRIAQADAHNSKLVRRLKRIEESQMGDTERASRLREAN